MTPPSLTRHDLQPVAMPMLTDGIDEEKLRLFWDACRRPANKGVVRELVSADMNLEDWFWTPESDQSRWAQYAVIDPPGGVRVLLTGFAADTNRGTIPLAFKLRRRTGAVIAHCETWGYIAGVKPPREGLTLGTAYLHPAILIEKDSRDVSALGELIIEVALSDMRYTSRIVTLGLVIFVLIPRDWFVGGSMVSGLAASGSGVPYLMILKIAVVAALYVLLAMGLLFSVPLTVIGERLPLASIAESFSTCRTHARPLLALVAPFFLVYLIIVLAFAKAYWLGYLLTLSAGLLALPLFVASIYCSYLALFINPSDRQRY